MELRRAPPGLSGERSWSKVKVPAGTCSAGSELARVGWCRGSDGSVVRDWDSRDRALVGEGRPHLGAHTLVPSGAERIAREEAVHVAVLNPAVDSECTG